MRTSAVAAALMCCTMLTSCAAPARTPRVERAVECVPDVVAVARVIARPGDAIELSAQAASCDVELARHGVLTLVLEPVGLKRAAALPLGTVEASPSGAYTTSVRVPERATPGDWAVRVSAGLVETECHDTGASLESCAVPEAYLHIAPADEDWTFGDAGRRATAVADRIERDLAGFPGLLGVEVLPGGVQLSVAHPFRDVVDRSIVAAGGEQPAATGTPIERGRVPVVRFNGFRNRGELTKLAARVEHDRPALREQGITIDDVALDPMTSTVIAHAGPRTDAVVRELARRYGSALVPK